MLVMFDVSEFSLYEINRELSGHQESDIKIIPILGSVIDRDRIKNIINK